MMTMKTVRVLYLLAFVFCTLPLRASNPKRSLQKFLSELVAIREDQLTSKQELYAQYREVLGRESKQTLDYLKDPKSLEQVTKDKRLSHLLTGTGESTLLNQLLIAVAGQQISGWAADFIGNSCSFLSNVPICSYLSDSSLEVLDSAINLSVKNFNFSETTAVTMLLSPEQGVDLSEVPESFKNFLQLVLEKYFDALDIGTKRSILSDVLLLEENAEPQEVLGVILNHCGPVLQKAFQLFSNDVSSPALTQVLNRLRQNIKAFPDSIAKEIIEREMGVPFTSVFKSFPKKPLAAASVGQVYLTQDLSGQKVIIKVQRPGIDKKAEGEFKLLRSLTEDESVLKFIKDLEEALAEELDFLIEVENIHKGSVYEGKMGGRLQINRELSSLKSTSKVLFLTCAKGQSIQKFGPEFYKSKKEALSELLYVWVREAIFGEERVFHADLHPGNVFFDVDKNSPSNYTLTLIDFGSVGQFTLQEAKSLFKIVFGIAFGKSRLIENGMRGAMTWKEDVREEDIKTLIHSYTASDTPGFNQAKELFDKAIKLGVLLPKSFIQFYRGQSFLEKQLMEVYKESPECKGQSQCAKASEDIAAIYKKVFKWNIAYDLWMQAGGCRDHATACMDNDVLFAFLRE
jgi:predicted unusual protein kinase regulating ubiquinone biosynthesis (AarF/ABC1/UbiB family)